MHELNTILMKMSLKKQLFLTLTILFLAQIGYSWNEHPLFTYPALKNHPIWNSLENIEAKELSSFLLANETSLERFLAIQEEWSRHNLPNYQPCPEALAFKVTGNLADIRERFFRAIRINPNTYAPLYRHPLPGQAFDTTQLADPHKITTLEDISTMAFVRYTWLNEGEMVAPFDVLVAATDEMDYGFDLGLFEDNNTYYGSEYKFGKQTFGNPNIEFSSQAPFHMSFYHEAAIVFLFAPFLKKTYLDYRLNLYKMLSEFAFEQGEPYWGWRFLGWSMHYLGDQTMPYHCAPLPGMSVWRMLWINLKAMLGWGQSKIDAVQLVSNRHLVMERYVWEVMRKAYLENDYQHPYFQALENPYPPQTYNDRFVYDVVSKQSVEKARNCDRTLRECFPPVLVNDPKVEASDRKEMDDMLTTVLNYSGQEGVDKLDQMIAERFRAYSFAMRALLEDVLPKINRQPEEITQR